MRKGAGPPGCESPFDALARVLSRTGALATLRIRLAHLTGNRSAWSPLFTKSPFAIPLGDALARAGIPYTLHNLTTLELDGFSNIDYLLRAAPRLRRLCLRLSGGFPQYVNVELVRGLAHVPQLRELLYTPATLRVRGETTVNPLDGLDAAGDVFWNFPDDGEDATAIPEDVRARVELIHAIGVVVPRLETLDLETRWYGKGTAFCTPHEILPSTVSPFISNMCLEYHC